MRRLWLIARREIAAYASLPTFCLALMTGPALFLLTRLASLSDRPHGPPVAAAQTVELRSADEGLRAAVAAAIGEANASGATHLEVVNPDGRRAPDTVVSLAPSTEKRLSILIQGEAVPSVAASLMRQAVTSKMQQRILVRAGVPESAVDDAAEVSVDVAVTRPPAAAAAAIAEASARVARFAVVMLLWMNLVGSLGMLLQAIVRERSHRALEGLLAATRPSEIIFGKLLGVGLLSLLVLAAWLGAGVGVASGPLAGAGAGFADMVLGAFKAPDNLALAAMVYLMAYGMYGSAMIGLGAAARDLPSAQNLSRPIFGVLLLVFFLALSQLNASGPGFGWMLWLPPLTPFVLMMAKPGALSVGEIVGAFVLMGATTAAVGALASTALSERRPWPWKAAAAAAA